ncbi:four helix bundle protein, partial [Candidatus Gottesmanbacteria bacterium]|nr:four helix bundle protein [Candidatus Gottesmanbacteria bacterium]
MNGKISKYSNRNKDIHKRIYDFVIRVLNLIKQLPKTSENLVFSEQLMRAVTSMGANDQEADASDSKRDFLAKY